MAVVHVWSLLLMLIALDKSTASIETDRCPTDLPSTSSINLFRDKCYQFVANERYWDEARDYCYENNGRLVKIDSAETNDFIVETLNSLWWQNRGVWIGLHDRNVEMSWQWVGNVPYSSDPVLWTNWGQGHPRAVLHTVRDCARMVRGSNSDWLWHETPCHMLNWKYRFICEYAASSTTVAPTRARTRATTSRSTFLPVPEISNHAGVDRRLGQSNDILSSYSRSTSNDDRPSFQAAVGGNDEKNSADDNKWLVVLLVIVGAALIVLIVGLVLFRRRRLARKMSMVASDSTGELSDSLKSCSGTLKSSESLDLPENSTLPRQQGMVRAISNIYVPTGMAFSRESSGIYEDISSQNLAENQSDDVGDDQTMGSNLAYVPMNGSNKNRPAPTYVCQVANACHLAINDRNCQSAAEYKNCPVDDSTMMGYDAPRSLNIYSEIPDEDIYESLECVKA